MVDAGTSSSPTWRSSSTRTSTLSRASFATEASRQAAVRHHAARRAMRSPHGAAVVTGPPTALAPA
eukprot:12913006-Heterocapsa_arctica.AAC.1